MVVPDEHSDAGQVDSEWPEEFGDGDWPDFAPPFAKYLWVYAGLPILILGTIAHMLSLLVLLGCKRMRSLSLSVLIVASALAGLATLYVGLLRQILRFVASYERDVRLATTDFGCRLHAALTYFSLQLFSWLQASVAVERTIAVWRPLQYKRWCTPKRNAVAVAAIIIVLGGLNGIVASSFSLKASLGCRAWQSNLFHDVWGYVDLILFSILPIAVMVPCNVATVISLCSRYYQNDRRASRSPAMHGSRRSLQFTVMLLAHNALFIATTLPISVVFLMPNWTHELGSTQYEAIFVAWTICGLLQYVGTMLGFTVYVLLARKFRQSMLNLLCRKCTDSVTPLNSISPSFYTRRTSEAGIMRQPSRAYDPGAAAADSPLQSQAIIRPFSIA